MNPKYNPTKPLFSIHIPKCAGTSFRDVLKAWYGPGLLSHYPDEVKGELPKLHSRWPLRKYRRNLCVHGHFNRARKTGVLDYYPDADQYITVLRDPFALKVSLYNFIKRVERNGASDPCWSSAFRDGKAHPIIRNQWSLEDYLEASPESLLLNFFPLEMTADNYQELLDNMFLFVGVSERLQETVDAMASVLGFDSMLVGNENISAERTLSIPDEKGRPVFEHFNSLDVAIYRYACDKLSF